MDFETKIITKTPDYIELLGHEVLKRDEFNAAMTILRSILKGNTPSESVVESCATALGEFLEKYFDSYLSDLNINDSDEKYKPEIEVIQLTADSRQFVLNGNGKSHRYVCALFFDTDEYVAITFPGVGGKVELPPRTAIIMPVCTTYRFEIDQTILPLNALCFFGTICFDKDVK